MTIAGGLALATGALYLVLFFWGTAEAARAAGRPVWLFGTATGRARLAAIGFRAGFALTLAGPLAGWAMPGQQITAPLWPGDGALGFIGAVVAVAGAMIAFAAQMSMGTSWRVGVAAEEVGALVTGGLYRLSRNPTFLGQGLLLAGIALTFPAAATLSGLALFLCSAASQIRDEETALRQRWGKAYDQWATKVPRWFAPFRG